MKVIDAEKIEYKTLNQMVKENDGDVCIQNCVGQRYIGAGLNNKKILIQGTPGNALGAYLDGAEIYVDANAQDAVGDTMNEGKIIINGNVGDALGYAMRGGKIFIKGYSGYRTGIHMKQYKQKKPIIVVGENAGSFLGEYLAGGIIIILGLSNPQEIAGNFTGTGMHGGKIFLRTKNLPQNMPSQVSSKVADAEDLKEIEPIIEEYCKEFKLDKDFVLNANFYVLQPNSANPYKQLYTTN